MTSCLCLSSDARQGTYLKQPARTRVGCFRLFNTGLLFFLFCLYISQNYRTFAASIGGLYYGATKADEICMNEEYFNRKVKAAKNGAT